MASKIEIVMSLADDKKNSVKFYTDNKDAPFDNLYIKRTALSKGAEYNGKIRVTVQFLSDAD